jgi:hypothetical protein
MIKIIVITVATVACAFGGSIPLGSAAGFSVLGGSTVTNTGSTTLEGSLGLYPGTSIVGEAGITVNGTGASLSPAVFINDATAIDAQADLTTAINSLKTMGPGDNLGTSYVTGTETLTPGVYSTPSSTFEVSGALTLNFQGLSDASFIFLVGSALTADTASSVVLENVGAGDSVFWVVGTSATIDANAAFEGNILAAASITFLSGATIDCGRALASSGAVTLSSNTISTGCENAPVTTGDVTATGNAFLEASDGLGELTVVVPEPGSAGLSALGGLVVIALATRRRPGKTAKPGRTSATS